MKTEVQSDPAEIPVTSLSGVGPVRAERLAKLGVATLRDVLLLIPRRLEIFEELDSLADLESRVGNRVRVKGQVASLSMYRRGWKRSVLRVRIEDEAGRLDLLYYNQGWMRKQFERGDQVHCEGLLVSSKGAAIVAPRLVSATESINEPSVVYPLTDGIGQTYLQKLCRSVSGEFAKTLVEPLDRELLDKYGLPGLPEAALHVHQPEDLRSFRAARRRLALEPILSLQARLAERVANRALGNATAIPVPHQEAEKLMAQFPAAFTAGQREIVATLAHELASEVPMRRLLQGDVGTGKTWIGAWAAAIVAHSGKQAALMAPTELLAEQHALELVPLFESLGLRAVLLTGSLDREAAREARAELADGRAQIAIGTHALLSDATGFRNLTLAIVDEQHRFGVAQRKQLFDKGRDVHVLLMTATPIPRTLALTIYGDMETSLLAERPPGRGTIRTRRVLPEKLEAMAGFLIERMELGERVFWVVPRIDGEEGADAAYQFWSEKLEQSSLEVELVHGRVAAAERGRRLDRFRSGESSLLIGTTIIEVGVDVPEATVMVVSGAHHLGLAQLHQIRGRVGRGAQESWCFLVGEESAAERMEALVQSSDGFEIAELDLLQRGMGSLTGARQAGTNDEGLDASSADLDLVLLAREVVQKSKSLRTRYAAISNESLGSRSASHLD